MKYVLLFLTFITQIAVAQHRFVLEEPVMYLEAYEDLYNECFARCLMAHKVPKTDSGYFSITLLPAVWDSSQVELSPAYTYYAVRKDTFLTVPKGEKARIVPPKYEIVQNRKRFDWQRLIVQRNLDSISDRFCLYAEPKLCIHLCMVDIPHEPMYYQTHQLIEPAKIIRQRSKTQVIEVLDSTSSLLEKKIVPPQYGMHKTCDVKKQRYRIEADFDFKPHLSEWRRIICCFRGSFATVTNIQMALQQRGYLEKITNKMNRKTKKALKRFQKDKGLPKENLNEITVKALGLLPLEK
jgi:hypothetical protein